MGCRGTQITLSQWYSCSPILRRPSTRISTCNLPVHNWMALRVITSSLKTSISSSSNGFAIGPPFSQDFASMPFSAIQRSLHIHRGPHVHLAEPSPHLGTPMRRGDVHDTGGSAGAFRRFLPSTETLIDPPLRLGAWQPRPIAGSPPDFLHGEGNMVCHSGSPQTTLAAIATCLRKGHDIQGHRSSPEQALRNPTPPAPVAGIPGYRRCTALDNGHSRTAPRGPRHRTDLSPHAHGDHRGHRSTSRPRAAGEGAPRCCGPQHRPDLRSSRGVSSCRVLVVEGEQRELALCDVELL